MRYVLLHMVVSKRESKRVASNTMSIFLISSSTFPLPSPPWHHTSVDNTLPTAYLRAVSNASTASGKLTRLEYRDTPKLYQCRARVGKSCTAVRCDKTAPSGSRNSRCSNAVRTHNK